VFPNSFCFCSLWERREQRQRELENREEEIKEETTQRDRDREKDPRQRKYREDTESRESPLCAPLSVLVLSPDLDFSFHLSVYAL